MNDTVLEIVNRDDGEFDLLLNQNLEHSQGSELSVEQWLGTRFSFCGEEFRAIMRTVEAEGRASVIL